MRSLLLAAFLASGALACASNTSRPTSGVPYANDVVTFDELARAGVSATNLYQALERIRPTFVRPRGYGAAARGTASQIDVFVNGGYAGDGSVLLTLHPSHVASIRMERRSQAFVRHGLSLRGENVLYITLLR
jgi:hypothetical protein